MWWKSLSVLVWSHFAGLRKGTDDITNDDGIPELLNWWRNRGDQFPKLSRMVKDVLAIQGSSVASKATFSAGKISNWRPQIFVSRRQLGDISVI